MRNDERHRPEMGETETSGRGGNTHHFVFLREVLHPLQRQHIIAGLLPCPPIDPCGLIILFIVLWWRQLSMAGILVPFVVVIGIVSL